MNKFRPSGIFLAILYSIFCIIMYTLPLFTKERLWHDNLLYGMTMICVILSNILIVLIAFFKFLEWLDRNYKDPEDND